MSSCLDSKVKRSARDTLTFQIKVYKPRFPIYITLTLRS